MDQTDKRLAETARRAWSRNIPLYTDFLGLNEQDILNRLIPSLPPVTLTLSGGAAGCERVMAGFGVEEGEPFPIACLRIVPNGPRFAETLTHRDVLGALMNLGFERELLGDIVIREKEAWVFCVQRIAEYITDNLIQIRKTAVHCEAASAPGGELFRTERRVVQVSSERLDALIARIWNMNREEAKELTASGKVFVSGRECLNPDARPEEGKIVSVRGYGRFRFVGAESVSRKGKLNTVIELYV